MECWSVGILKVNTIVIESINVGHPKSSRLHSKFGGDHEAGPTGNGPGEV